MNPTPVPRATGRRMDTAGVSNIAGGNVIEGIYVVIFEDTLRDDQISSLSAMLQ